MEHKHLFDESELASLRKAEFDQRAARTYDMLSGGFRWSDERLDLATNTWAFRYVLGYRASLSNGAALHELRAAWDQLLSACPDWPGFRPERCATALAAELAQECERVVAELDAVIEE